MSFWEGNPLSKKHSGYTPGYTLENPMFWPIIICLMVYVTEINRKYKTN